MDPIEALSDNEWQQALRSDDPQALRAVFDRHYPLLVGDIYRLIPDVDTCRDLAQDVFVELWTKRERLVVQGTLRAYLRRAAVNRALNYIKQQRRFAFGETEEIPVSLTADSETPGELSVQDIREDRLRQAIEALPEKCRVVFCLSRFEHLSHKEIADQLEISTKTIENQITRAMRLLRQAMLEKGDLSSVVIWWLFYCLLG